MAAETPAYQAIRVHHQVLSERLCGHVAALCDAVTAGQPHEAAAADLVTYLTDAVIPHAAAEEQTLYPAVAANTELAGIVSSMTAEHQALSAAAGRLADLPDGLAAAEQARQIGLLFTEHANRENDVLLPALLASSDTDFGSLLTRMYRHAEEAAKLG